ncbi:MAG: hypothetical protein GXP49_13210 [Deltaproteobacteria bacterium]|nr:hypothetical protein [Deltaproteobacteria bacterium]
MRLGAYRHLGRDLLALVLLAGHVASSSSCDEPGSGGGKYYVCAPGAEEPCSCGSGLSGLKRCSDDGEAWLECECNGGDTDVDVDTDTGTGTARPAC